MREGHVDMQADALMVSSKIHIQRLGFLGEALKYSFMLDAT